MIRVPGTLSTYVGRQFLYWFGCVLLSLLAVVFVFDIVELLRRTSSKAEIGIGTVLTMALLKLPAMAQTVLPFAVLFGGMLTYFRLTRSQELVVARAAGVSVWQFLLPAMVSALIIGIVKTTIFNPFASVMTQRYDQIESEVFRGRTSLMALSESGIWLRQSSPGGHSILHALGMSQKDMEMMDVTVFLFEGLERFAGRIDAARARLENGYWHLQDVWISQRTRVPDRFPEYRLPTDLTTETIQDSFAAPETMSFWDLPAFIDVLERAGFSASRHRLHLHALLAGPFLLTAMVLIAATFSLRMVRRGGVMLLAGCGLLTGFVIYFFSDVVFALGVSARLPVELAAWAPTIVTGLLGLASLLHLEDG